MKEYKILTQADSFWRDRFSAAALEDELNKRAREGWRVVTCTTTDFNGLGGIGTKRHELFVLLERDAAEHVAPAPPSDDWQASRIPANRNWYLGQGRISTVLAELGISDEDIDRARMQFAARGGHLLDHVFALGIVDEEAVRRALKGE